MTRLYRSRTDKKLFGVCGGIAEMLDVDSTLLRLIVIVTTVCSGGMVAVLYFLAGIVIPQEDGVNSSSAYTWSNFSQPSAQSSQRQWRGSFGCAHREGSRHHTTTQADTPLTHPSQSSQTKKQDDLDALMREVEAKALRNEIEELKQKLSKFEKGEG